MRKETRMTLPENLPNIQDNPRCLLRHSQQNSPSLDMKHLWYSWLEKCLISIGNSHSQFWTTTNLKLIISLLYSHFRLTLIGISVTDFCEIGKNGIEKFLCKKRSSEDVGHPTIEKPKKRRVVEEDDDRQEIPAEWDSDVFNNLPEDIRKELLSQSAIPVTPPTPKIKKNLGPKNNSILNYFHKNK